MTGYRPSRLVFEYHTFCEQMKGAAVKFREQYHLTVARAPFVRSPMTRSTDLQTLSIKLSTPIKTNQNPKIKIG